MVFEEAFTQMEEAGTFELLLPFGLVFILVYAILEKSNLLGAKNKVWSVLISGIVGLLLVRQGDLVELINTYIPNVSIVVVVFFGMLLILGLFGFGSGAFRGGLMIVFVLVSLVGGIWAFVSATEQGEFELHIPFWDETVEIQEADAGMMIIIGVFFLVIAIAIGYKPKKKGFEGFMQGMQKMGDTFAGVNQPPP